MPRPHKPSRGQEPPPQLGHRSTFRISGAGLLAAPRSPRVTAPRGRTAPPGSGLRPIPGVCRYLDGPTPRSIPPSPGNAEGMGKLFRGFSFPGGIGSHVTPEVPGSIHQGGAPIRALSRWRVEQADSPAPSTLRDLGHTQASSRCRIHARIPSSPGTWRGSGYPARSMRYCTAHLCTGRIAVNTGSVPL